MDDIVRASASPAHSTHVRIDSPLDRSRSGSGGGSFFSGKKAPFWSGSQGEHSADKPPPTMAQVAEKNYERFRKENERLMSNKWDFSSRMPRSKETEARMKILVLVTTAISIIVVFLFTITYPYINNDIGYDDGPTAEPAASFCPLLIPPEYGRLNCNSVRSIDSVKVECQVWCDHGASNSTLNSTADGIAGVALQITCLDSEIWGVSQESLSSLCAAPAPKNVTDT